MGAYEYTEYTPPTATATVITGTLGANDTYVSPVLMYITAQDSSGVSAIHYFINGVEVVVTGGALAPISLTADGLYTISYYAVDTYGNVEPTEATTIKIDTTAPKVSSSVPANKATAVVTTSSIVITFSEAVTKGSAFANIALKKGSTTVAATTTLSGNRLTIKPTSALSKSTAYTVTLPANAVIDAAGNNSAAYTSSFTTGTR
jgi:methionine-rich copper-binding protein CopC